MYMVKLCVQLYPHKVDEAKMNQLPLMHHEGGIVDGLEAIFPFGFNSLANHGV
jgi:hypothetical protein